MVQLLRLGPDDRLRIQCVARASVQNGRLEALHLEKDHCQGKALQWQQVSGSARTRWQPTVNAGRHRCLVSYALNAVATL